MRVDPFSLRRPVRPVHERSFTDEAAPGCEITLWLRALDSPCAFLSMERTADLVARYITGEMDEEGNRQEPAAFPEIGGEPVQLSESLLKVACRLEAMQSPTGPNGEPRQAADGAYSAEEFVALSVTMPDAWAEILAWSNGLQTGERKLPNA